ncbi:hypothetical protein F1721_06615 [Saccharopolyspora hirsuta]|uniref:Uncharacterized protein n=1 Tax=Saccharopolyspora hirsuta TaxID=1837 RepID=A0A5M7CC97_SACHI|nr:hypothetical protein [Saccharopolyspora hirsuta]KAA5836015.1 hypothetical protein F1721_06615 [Saccharopolyspora hirsuta]
MRTPLDLHGVTTLLYVAPIPTTLLPRLELDDLVDYVAAMAEGLPVEDRERLEQGLAALVERGGPRFERERYQVARALARAVRANPEPGQGVA